MTPSTFITRCAALLDRTSDRLAGLAAWLFFIIGGMLVYEVLTRYLFNAPTVWAEELSRFLQVWAVYLAAASLLHHRQMIRIGMLTDRLSPAARSLADALGMLFVAAFSALGAWYGVLISAESVRLGRTTATMLDVPQWTTEIAIPVGLVLLTLQCLLEAARSLSRMRRGEAPPGNASGH